MNVVLLSRIQFALTIMFHYLFPPLTIGLGVVLVYLQAMYFWTNKAIYESAARFWTRVFAATFAVGVATGIVMEFQFGTNWSAFSRYVGDVAGGALASEGIFAFFLESGLLAVMVFGWDRVPRGFLFVATLLVALGSIFSAFWIVVTNSWQQTPAGYRIAQMTRDGRPWFVDGRPVFRAELADFWSVIFNPSTMNRIVHVLIGAFILGAFFVMSVSAYYILRRRHEEFAYRSFTGGLMLGTIFSLAQLVSGHSNGVMVAREQPAKLGAMEAHFHTALGNLSFLGIPDEKAQRLKYRLAIPRGLSLLVHGNPDAPVTGLDAFPREDWPPITLTYAVYHVMVAIGMFFIGLTLLASYFRWRKTLFQKRWLMVVFVGSVVLAAAANELGWVTAEVGRQPWIVQAEMKRGSDGWVETGPDGKVEYQYASVAIAGQGEVRVLKGMRTSQGVSEAITGNEVFGSIVMFGVIYPLLGAIWVFVMTHLINIGPRPVREGRPVGGLRELFRLQAKRIEHEESISDIKGDGDANRPDAP
ncbi:MAG: cytochrome bd quinol oxidase subunit 1 apoprotein [Phycisphaerales bacterium]|nr:cytochrome bd quinol oxidase subunit 1 apoprotein [Phycisphaerales bacterium]